MNELRFRQVHLDFHSSPAIENIGAAFDKKQWQDSLKLGHINSITCFAKCHHGWSYHPTKVGKQHPNLKFDLLRAQYDAAKEIDVNVPVYLSAGLDNVASHDHPEWREISPEKSVRPEIIEPGFHKMCLNGPYLDYLCEQTSEVAELFPRADGIFLDIIHQGQCCCRWCLEMMKKKGFDASKEDDRKAFAQMTLDRYYQKVTQACKSVRQDMPVFHNSGHITRGNRKVLDYFDHLELESLPTGGWGYDHFPISAKYCQNLPLDFLGMTGKFHTTWGEFGGFKHPNALQYECAAMLAYGAKCSIGDQLHPSGKMDASTYKLIGQAYAQVEAKEPFCRNVQSIADIGLLSCESFHSGMKTARHDNVPDTGAGRILLEGHFLFNVLDAQMDFSRYKLLILPDGVPLGPQLKAKLDDALANGTKLLLTGRSGLNPDGSGFAFDIGADWLGQSEYQPDYVLPHEAIRPSFVDSPLVMYLPSQRIKVTNGKSLGDIYDPYFNRTYEHFCSHQHAPARTEPSGFQCGVHNQNITYLAHPVFSIYQGLGAVAYKQYIINVIKTLLAEPTVELDLPSTSRVTLMHQPEDKRYILHLLYANTISRGGPLELSGGTLAGKASIEVIEELLPLGNIDITLRAPRPVCKVMLEPQGLELPFVTSGDCAKFTLEEFICHQMIVIHYEN